VSDQETAPPWTDGVAERDALRREFWRRAPNWVHGLKFRAPTPVQMRDVEAGLRRLL
jgi:hypothetical protein